MGLFIYFLSRSFVVGYLPLIFALSPSQLRLVSSIGMGVLVGTSLIVIIPEGVETLYSANAPSTRRHISSRDVNVESINWYQPAGSVAKAANIQSPSDLHVLNVRAPASFASPIPPEDPELSPEVAVNDDTQLKTRSVWRSRRSETRKDDTKGEKTESGKEGHEDNSNESSAHAWTGIALISGFVLMYLIDMLPEFVLFSKQQRPLYHVSLDNLGSGLRRSSSPSRESGLLDPGNSSKRSHSFATTIGLVIHAAADGIALGASSSDTGLGFIIFLAIMVHKAPASFGLTSVLLKQGLSTRSVRAHLLAFSVAAPVGALTTFLFVQIAGSGLSGDEQGTRWRTGMLLLFSAGTFL